MSAILRFAGSLLVAAGTLVGTIPPAFGLPNDFINETLLSGIGRNLSIDFLPDGRMLTGQKNGKIRISDPSQGTPLSAACSPNHSGGV